MKRGATRTAGRRRGPFRRHARPEGAVDLRRADDAQREAAYDRRTACEAATSAMVRYGAAR